MNPNHFNEWILEIQELTDEQLEELIDAVMYESAARQV
jgi:hypothetical protein